MDEVIFEEFKGTGNSEIILDRKLTDKRLFPTIDITRSGTRKEELLVDKATLSKMWVLRRVLMQMGMTDGMEFLLDKLRLSKDNQDFFNTMNSWRLNIFKSLRQGGIFFVLKKHTKYIDKISATFV